MKILIVGSSARSLFNFRGDLIQSIQDLGHEVVGVAESPKPEIRRGIESLGCSFVPSPISRAGLNPFHDFKYFLFLCRLLVREQPDVVLCYTIKPVIWGGIAALLTRRSSFFALVTGLGYAFNAHDFRGRLIHLIVKSLYKLALFRSRTVIFQNTDNLELFIEKGLVTRDKVALVNGSGVNLSSFEFAPCPQKPLVFLTVARLLKAKGLSEFYAAAQSLKRRYPTVTFQIVGAKDNSPDRIDEKEFSAWERSGNIEYLGWVSDVRPYIEGCSVFVLASYHEGIPRSTLEAMAVGRAIVTTNAPGCKETVIDGFNGYKVTAANSKELEERMEWFIKHSESLQLFGEQSRTLVEDRFDVRIINDHLLNILGLKEF